MKSFRNYDLLFFLGLLAFGAMWLVSCLDLF